MRPEATTAVSVPHSIISIGRDVCRRMLAFGLYHSPMLRVFERIAGSYVLRRSPGSSMPRLQPSAGSKFGILCYHRVGTEGAPLFSRLDPSIFEAQMRHVKKHYRVVPLGQLCEELRDQRKVEPTLAITFDDGYRDLYTHAFPVLQKYEIPATIYLIGRCMKTGEVPWYDRIFAALKAAPGAALEVDMDGPCRLELGSAEARLLGAWRIVSFLRTIDDSRRRAWCAAFEDRIGVSQKELDGRMLDWEHVRTMHRSGVSFGAHTMSHPSVSQLSNDAFEEEFVHAKHLLEEGLGAPVLDFAYPFGKPNDCSTAAEAFVARCGYRSAVTTSEGYNTSGTSPYRLRRLQIDDDRSMASFAFSLGRLFLEGSCDVPAPSSENPECEGLPQTAESNRIGS
jgi:peptidoglycan/xylan/chitin deacetylase (PgdA/CDA1 family)